MHECQSTTNELIDDLSPSILDAPPKGLGKGLTTTESARTNMAKRKSPQIPNDDPGAKWLLGLEPLESLWYLAGLTNLVECRPLQPDTLVSRRTPDRVFEVRLAGSQHPSLLLVEVSAYPHEGLSKQMEDSILSIRLAYDQTPDALSIVQRPLVSERFSESRTDVGAMGLTSVQTSWKMIQMWEIDAEWLLATKNPTLLPWAVLARRQISLDSLLERIRGLAEQWLDAPLHREEVLTITAMFAHAEAGDEALQVLFGSETT